MMHRRDPFDLGAKKRQPGNATMSCSTCGRSFRIDLTPTPPFCSERCQMIDLGRWLDEEISVPHEGGNSDVSDTNRQDETADSDE